MSNNQALPPLSADGRARMVGVSPKYSMPRTAIAKGKLLAVDDILAVIAAKATPRLITRRHSLTLNGVEILRRAGERPPRCRLEDGSIAIVTDMDEVYPHLPHHALDEMTGLADSILSPSLR